MSSHALLNRSDRDEIMVAVVTGGHSFDVPAFQDLFDRMPHVRGLVQTLDNWALDWGKVWDKYDVHLFYNMHAGHGGKSLSVSSGREAEIWAAIDRLGESGQGLVVLHHGLVAFQKSQTWSDICGIQDRVVRDYAFEQQVITRIADGDHPVMRGIDEWTPVEETYVIDDTGRDSTVLVTTDHPRSMKTLVWVRQYRQARVFCCQPGHYAHTYAEPTFQKVLLRGIQWAAGRI